jgi:hypothetical protein
MKRFLTTSILTLAVLTFSLAFAQGGFVSAGVAGADIPLFVAVGYNDTLFGVRLSADTTFAGVEGYGRLQLFEDGSSFYLGLGIGLRPYALWKYQSLPPNAESSEVPLSVTSLFGLEFRTEDVGFFLEYAPTFPVSGRVEFDDLLGLFHARLGVSYYF